MAELNDLPLDADIYNKYPELEDCGPMSSQAFANTLSTRSARSLVDAWGEPDETSISAWNLMIWMIPLAPLTVWEWTRFDRTVEMTIWHPLARGYRGAVWKCDFGTLRPR